MPTAKTTQPLLRLVREPGVVNAGEPTGYGATFPCKGGEGVADPQDLAFVRFVVYDVS
jgi:hypothetical protein